MPTSRRWLAALRCSAAIATAGAALATYMMACSTSNLGCTSLTVCLIPDASIKITPTTLPNGTVGAAYSQQLSASGGTAPYGWFVAEGSLPPGLALDDSTSATTTAGLLHGTPTSANGPYDFTVWATDATGKYNSANYSINVLLHP